jgi:hypothetical protein
VPKKEEEESDYAHEYADGQPLNESSESEDEKPTEYHHVMHTGRICKPAPKYADEHANYHITNQPHETVEYSSKSAKHIANVIHSINAAKVDKSHKHYAFLQTHNLKQGLKKFGEKGHTAASKDMKQLHDRAVFAPTLVSELTRLEKKWAMNSLIFLVKNEMAESKLAHVLTGAPKGLCRKGTSQQSHCNY